MQDDIMTSYHANWYPITLQVRCYIAKCAGSIPADTVGAQPLGIADFLH